jgi:hypothetical protein
MGNIANNRLFGLRSFLAASFLFWAALLSSSPGFAKSQLPISAPERFALETLALLDSDTSAVKTVAELRRYLGQNSSAVFDQLQVGLKSTAQSPLSVRKIYSDKNFGDAIRIIYVYESRPAAAAEFVYYRYVFKKKGDGWHLTGFRFKSSGDGAPFPEGWTIE